MNLLQRLKSVLTVTQRHAGCHHPQSFPKPSSLITRNLQTIRFLSLHHANAFRTQMPSSRYIITSATSTPDNAPLTPSIEELDVELPSHCAGCGIGLQTDNPSSPGYFQVPKKLIERLVAQRQGGNDEDVDLIDDEEDGVAAAAAAAAAAGGEEEEPGRWNEFDDMVESWLDGGPNSKVHVQAYDEGNVDIDPETSALSGVLCARCFSLRNYGKVKSEEAESEIEKDYNFENRVGKKIINTKFRRHIVLAVVDVSDFDGSLPRSAIQSILSPEELRMDMTKSFPRSFRLIIAVNKSDLLPNQVTPKRLENWVRKRVAQGGLPRPSAVHIISSSQKWGVRELLSDLQRAVGTSTKGDIWVIGAQNAGKSSLINAMRAEVGLKQERDVTTAPLPGTTLGLIKVPGLVPRNCRMYDTPGVLHRYQVAPYMTAEEMKLLLPKRRLKPRTYRLGAGQTVSVGGIARVDVLSCPGSTMYLTVWCSDQVGCHMGKTDSAEERYVKHVGSKLMPPVGDAERMKYFPSLMATEVSVEGDSWKDSTVDVGIGGIGWVGVGVAGAADLRVWAPPGVAITTRDALVPDYAKELERPGFGSVIGDLGKGVNSGGGGGGGSGGKGKGNAKKR
jgi:ribosome biogenesis GTPase A